MTAASYQSVSAIDAERALIYRDGILDQSAHDAYLKALGYEYLPDSACCCGGTEDDGHMPCCGWGRRPEQDKPLGLEPPEVRLSGVLSVYPGKPLDLADRQAIRAVLDALAAEKKRAKLAEGMLRAFVEDDPNILAELDAANAKLEAIEKIIDDHTDGEGPMPETGGYIVSVDPGALDAIVELLRPAGGK